MRKTIVAALLSVAGTLVTTTASAAPITYDFGVTAANGPLAGVSSSGFFTFDDSLAVPNSSHLATGLLDDLSFTWDSIAYTAAEANTGGLIFNASGGLTAVFFGTNCVAGLCFQGAWSVTGGPTFSYDSATGLGNGTATFQLRTASVPEPGSLALLSLGLVVLGAVTCTRRRKANPLQFVA